jgi:CRP-like cAMP-binding protein
MSTTISNSTDDPPRRSPIIMVPALWASGENSGRPLTPQERALLAVISTVVRFRRGERIYAEGDRADAVFNIISGVVKPCRTLPGGRQHIAGFCLPMI